MSHTSMPDGIRWWDGKFHAAASGGDGEFIGRKNRELSLQSNALRLFDSQGGTPWLSVVP